MKWPGPEFSFDGSRNVISDDMPWLKREMEPMYGSMVGDEDG